MSWISHDRTGDTDLPDERLVVARDAFREAQRILESARQDLFEAHIATTRLWSSTR